MCTFKGGDLEGEEGLDSGLNCLCIVLGWERGLNCLCIVLEVRYWLAWKCWEMVRDWLEVWMDGGDVRVGQKGCDTGCKVECLWLETA